MSDLDNDGMESDSVEDEEMDSEEDSNETGQVYLPGGNVGESNENSAPDSSNLEYDESAYILYQQAQTGAPCLSFDIIKDNLGDDRSEIYPQTAYLVAGTQAERSHANNIMVIKMSNLHKTKQSKAKEKSDEDEQDSSDSDDDDEDGDGELPSLNCAMVKHQGCVNRVSMSYINKKPYAASWSEVGKVNIYDLTAPLQAVNNSQAMSSYIQRNESPKPIFTFSGHLVEGFAVDWSSTAEGTLATGDCNKNIHIWKPKEDGVWYVDQKPYVGHTASVEDLQWSPSEANVLASCSVDKSIRIWDMRSKPDKACKLTALDAHTTDVNVISWNKLEPFILSGGDDGAIKVWDLRQFQKGKPVAVFKHHTAPITSVEWHPKDSTVYVASGSDNQITLWDLAVERDDSDVDTTLSKLPPQLLFIHQGQTDIKEVHWHPQIPGLILSTAQSGFNVFRTISV